MAELLGDQIPDPARRAQACNRRINVAAKNLGWSSTRLTKCKEFAAKYIKDSGMQNYFELRQQFPELEVDAIGSAFSDLESVRLLEDEFRTEGVDPQLVENVVLGEDNSIDALSLHVIELILDREKLPKDVPGHLHMRRNAISGAMVSYLIATMLESVHWGWGPKNTQIPQSLVILIRDRLCGPMPDLHAKYVSRRDREIMASNVAMQLKPGEALSVRKLAKLAKVPPTTAARLLANRQFMEWLNLERE